MNLTCPKCGFEESADARECSRCGIVFAKFGRPAPAAVPHVASAATPDGFTHPAALPDVFDDRPLQAQDNAEAFARRMRDADGGEARDGRIGRTELRIIGIGLVMAVALYAFPLTRFLFDMLVILFHELGHAVAGWLLGYPSVPSFDFVYGGGLTPHGPFQLAIALAIVAGFGYLGYIFRGNPRTVALIAAVFLVWLFIDTSEWRRLMVVTAAGHASESIFSGIFLYMALAGVGWRVPELERPLGAFVAFFTEFHMINFCSNLMHDADFLEVYKQGKGGALMHDIDSLSADFIIHTPWHPSIQTLARLLLIYSFVPMTVAVILYFQRVRVRRVLETLAPGKS